MSALDVKGRHILARYPDDPNFTWRHRLLLARISAGRWAVLTPTGDLQILVTATVGFGPPARGRPVPERSRNDCFLFDPIPVRELSEALARAKVVADIAGEDVEVDAEGAWVICDTNHVRFGEQIEPGISDDATRAMLREVQGVVHLDANGPTSEVRVENVASGEFDEWKNRKGGGGDLRLLGTLRSAGERRSSNLLLSCPPPPPPPPRPALRQEVA